MTRNEQKKAIENLILSLEGKPEIRYHFRILGGKFTCGIMRIYGRSISTPEKIRILEGLSDIFGISLDGQRIPLGKDEILGLFDPSIYLSFYIDPDGTPHFRKVRKS